MPTLKLDHLVFSTSDLGAGAAELRRLLGVALEPGGAHPLMGTHNQLISLGPDLYLELLAIDPAAPPPRRSRWMAMDWFEGPVGLTHWVVASTDLAASLAQAPQGAGLVQNLTRGDLSWQMSVPETGRQPFDDLFPPLIQWHGSFHPIQMLTDRGCRLARLEVSHPMAGLLRAGLPGLTDPRLEILDGPPGIGAVLDTPNGLVSLPR